MVNKTLFPSLRGALTPAANTTNAEGASAYALSPRHQLAQLAATGCLSQTFYASAETELAEVLALAAQVDAEFVARTAVYARQAGHMKDMPSLLLATLATRDVALMAQTFGAVIDSGKMLRNWVQVLRSGVTGRQSLGSRPKKLVQRWLLNASEAQLLHASVGTMPSLADVVKMVHPKPDEAWRAAWFAWLIGKPHDEAALPPVTRAFEQYKRAALSGDAAAVAALPLPAVPFQMLTALPLDSAQWARIAAQGSWQMVRQNLNTFARHGVFAQPGLAAQIAGLLRDPQAVARARVLPYQLLAAYHHTEAGVPGEVREALQDAMELALAQVPTLSGRVVVCPDVSGSMGSAVTGHRQGATSTVRCIDVAALVAAALVRRNPQTRVLPFEQGVVSLALNPQDSVMTNAAKLAAIGGGGTNVSAPLALLNKERAAVDLVVIVSDNESWIDHQRHGATETQRQWAALKARCPQAKLVCIDIQPRTTTQVVDAADVMNIGGFSDAVFGAMGRFVAGETGAAHWVAEIDKVVIASQ